MIFHKNVEAVPLYRPFSPNLIQTIFYRRTPVFTAASRLPPSQSGNNSGNNFSH
jgi:hypothetical protein